MGTDRASRLRGSSPGPHPRIRAAEACCVPSYRGESWLPVAGCPYAAAWTQSSATRNPSPADLLGSMSLYLRVARAVAAWLSVAGCRLPSRLPVAGGCRR